jgi:hypothetical protein
MSKVRVWHENVFIAHLIDSDIISGKCHLIFVHKRIANSSDTKRIAVRKLKAYWMNLIVEIGLAMDDVNSLQQHIQIN